MVLCSTCLFYLYLGIIVIYFLFILGRNFIYSCLFVGRILTLYFSKENFQLKRNSYGMKITSYFWQFLCKSTFASQIHETFFVLNTRLVDECFMAAGCCTRKHTSTGGIDESGTSGSNWRTSTQNFPGTPSWRRRLYRN